MNEKFLLKPEERADYNHLVRTFNRLPVPTRNDIQFGPNKAKVSLLDMHRVGQALNSYNPDTEGSLFEYVSAHARLDEEATRQNVTAHEKFVVATRETRPLDFQWGESVRPDMTVFRPETTAIQRRRAARMGEPLPMTESQA
jgi:hypothetical protein